MSDRNEASVALSKYGIQKYYLFHLLFRLAHSKKYMIAL